VHAKDINTLFSYLREGE